MTRKIGGQLGAQVYSVFCEHWNQWGNHIDTLSREASTRRGAQRLKERMTTILSNAKRDFPKIFLQEVNYFRFSQS